MRLFIIYYLLFGFRQEMPDLSEKNPCNPIIIRFKGFFRINRVVSA
jgi:hypothetical protein